jgi:hypothetical protein
MKVQVEISLKERSTSVTVEEKTGIAASAPQISEILFDLKMRRCRFGSLVRDSVADSEGIRLSSSVKSVIVALSVCADSAV